MTVCTCHRYVTDMSQTCTYTHEENAIVYYVIVHILCTCYVFYALTDNYILCLGSLGYGILANCTVANLELYLLIYSSIHTANTTVYTYIIIIPPS